MTLASVLAGLGLGASVVMLIALLTGRWQPTTPTWRTARPVMWARRIWRSPYRGDAARRNHQRRMVTAAIAAGAVWLVTGLPVFAVIVAVAIPSLPWLLGGGRLEEDAIARMEAIQAWTRRLNDLVATGTGLQQAIVSSVDTVPSDIAGEVRQLAARLRAGHAPLAALSHFADDLGDEHADEVIAAIVQHMSTRGARLSDVLVGIADSAAAQIANRRAVIHHAHGCHNRPRG